MACATEKRIMLELISGNCMYKAFAEEISNGTFSINVDERDIEWSLKRDFLCFGRYIIHTCTHLV